MCLTSVLVKSMYAVLIFHRCADTELLYAADTTSSHCYSGKTSLDYFWLPPCHPVQELQDSTLCRSQGERLS